MSVTFITSTFNPATIVQRNAVYSWKKAGIPFFLLGSSDITDAAIIESVKTEKDLGFPGNSPIIVDMVRQVLPKVSTEMIGLINADILIEDSFLSTLEKIINRYGRDIFLTSVRKDTLWESPINNDSDLKLALKSDFVWHQDASADLFLTSVASFRRFVDEFPDFIYGRLAWDNAMHVYFKMTHIPCYNTSNYLRLYHQNHGYGHLASTDFKTLQRNPTLHPSTNYNCHLFGNFMNKLKVGMSNIPRVKSSFPEPEMAAE